MAEFFGFDGAVCGECWRPLRRTGYCSNRRCPYSIYFQDEPGGWQELQQRKQVAANTLSMRFYLWGSPGYKRNLRSPHSVIFSSAAEAERAGYELRED